MTFKYREYEDLVKDIKLAVDSLLLEKGKKTKEEGFLADEARYARVQGLKTDYPDRHRQTQYLLTIIELLEKSVQTEEFKKTVLNAAAFYIYHQIKNSYENSTVTYILPSLLRPSPTRSELYNGLFTALNLGAGYPNEKQLFQMYDELHNFIKSQVYHPDGLLSGFIENHPFSEDKVIGYNVAEDLKKLSTLVQKLENKIRDKAAIDKNQDNNAFFKKSPSVIDDYSKQPFEFEFNEKDDEDFLWDNSYENESSEEEARNQDEEEKEEASNSACI